MVGNESCTKHLIIPIIVCVVSPVVEIGVCIATAIIVDTFLEMRNISIVVTFKHHGSILLRVTKFQHVRGFLETNVSIVGNLCLLVLCTLFGSDEYHTIGCTHTIDGCSRSILKNGEVLNVVVVKEGNVVVEHTIYYIERRRVLERTSTTNANGRCATRCT